jgi:hypothetical protein
VARPVVCLPPAKRAVKFGEHLYDSVLERVPHRHCGFTLPKRLRGYFRYDRSLNNILFQAAATAVHSLLGSDTQTTALILTVQTAGEALNFDPHLHGLLADEQINRDSSVCSEFSVGKMSTVDVFLNNWGQMELSPITRLNPQRRQSTLLLNSIAYPRDAPYVTGLAITPERSGCGRRE